jgi:hypothetical protein
VRGGDQLGERVTVAGVDVPGLQQDERPVVDLGEVRHPHPARVVGGRRHDGVAPDAGSAQRLADRGVDLRRRDDTQGRRRTQPLPVHAPSRPVEQGVAGGEHARQVGDRGS